MAYEPPVGSAANFSLSALEFPRPYNGLRFKFPAGSFTAPVGSSITAQFPAPPADWGAPLGSAANFVLPGFAAIIGNGAATIGVSAEGYGNSGFIATGSSTISVTTEGHGTAFAPVRGNVRSGVGNAWAKANAIPISADSPHPVTVRSDQSKDMPWDDSQARDVEGVYEWIPPARTDTDRLAPFGAFGEMLNEDRGSAWKPSKTADDRRKSLWSIFGEMLNEERGARWVTAVPTDHRKNGAWSGHLITHRRVVPFPRPNGNAVNFAVLGGGITSVGSAGGYVPPLGNALHFVFGNTPYIVPFMVPERDYPYVIPKGNAASFFYNPAYELLLDGTGNPILDKATADRAEVYPWGASAHRDSDTDHPWTKYSRPLNPGWGITIPGTPTPVPGESIIIPVQRVYVMINEIQLLRVSTVTPIPALSLNISFDCDSWVPTFSANIPEASREMVMPDPTPVEVEAIINGIQFRFFVEKISRNRQFAQKTVSISGRGIACELEAPYAVMSQHTNASTVNAQQLITAALEFTGYTQTWNITDWSVPANAFSLYGTPAQVAGSVAEASGSVLAADWLLRDLRMLPRYPVKPWDWATATPDYVIPGAVAQTESLEWIEKPSYNVVYVSGVQSGVLGQVKIGGTAGDLPAPMVTHPLITHDDAARQRGISILSDTGRKAMMQISLPVLDATGVIDICKLIEFNDGTTARRGIVRANNISAQWPTVRQTLTVEAVA